MIYRLLVNSNRSNSEMIRIEQSMHGGSLFYVDVASCLTGL